MHTPTDRKRTRGFTLIETMVVVVVIGILLIPGIATYNRMNEQAQVQRAATSIMSALLAVQKDADSGVGANLCQSGFPYNGTVLHYNGNGTYEERVRCVGGEGSGDGTPIKTAINVNIPATVIVENFVDISFQVLSQGIAVEQMIVVRNPANSVRYQIEIERAGGISVSKVP